MIWQQIIKIEVKKKIKSCIIWCIIWFGMALMMASMFDILQDTIDQEFMASLGQDLMSLMNADLDYLSKVEKFVGGEFLTFYAMTAGILAVIMGVNSIGGRIYDKTITQLATKKVSRTGIYISQLVSNIIYFVVSSIAIGILTYFSFYLLSSQDSISIKYFFNAFAVVLILEIATFSLGQMLGVLIKKNIAQSAGVGFVVITWFFDSLSKLDGFPEFLQYISPFHYLNIPHINKYFVLNQPDSLVLIFTSIVMITIGAIAFNKKDIYI